MAAPLNTSGTRSADQLRAERDARLAVTPVKRTMRQPQRLAMAGSIVSFVIVDGIFLALAMMHVQLLEDATASNWDVNWPFINIITAVMSLVLAAGNHQMLTSVIASVDEEMPSNERLASGLHRLDQARRRQVMARLIALDNAE